MKKLWVVIDGVAQVVIAILAGICAVVCHNRRT